MLYGIWCRDNGHNGCSYHCVSKHDTDSIPEAIVELEKMMPSTPVEELSVVTPESWEQYLKERDNPDAKTTEDRTGESDSASEHTPEN